MQDPEAGGRPLYDHTKDDPRPPGRRRRPAADWGVGEEIFDRLPSRRFVRDSHRPIPRGGADDGRRTIVIEGAPPVEDDSLEAEEFASRDEALRAREENEALWGGDEPFADRDEPPAEPDDPPSGDAAWTHESFGRHDERGGHESSARADEWFDGRKESFAHVDESLRDGDESSVRGDESFVRGGESFIRGDESFVHGDGVVRGGVAGRRTVKIGGRPGDLPSSFDRSRRRPPRTVGERLGPRPDRVAAWAFLLGLVLILIAVVTASADASTSAEAHAQPVTAPAPAAVEVRSFTAAR
jgi:hypothetical protein